MYHPSREHIRDLIRFYVERKNIPLFQMTGTWKRIGEDRVFFTPANSTYGYYLEVTI